jgi:hypothetical protein
MLLKYNGQRSSKDAAASDVLVSPASGDEAVAGEWAIAVYASDLELRIDERLAQEARFVDPQEIIMAPDRVD